MKKLLSLFGTIALTGTSFSGATAFSAQNNKLHDEDNRFNISQTQFKYKCENLKYGEDYNKWGLFYYHHLSVSKVGYKKCVDQFVTYVQQRLETVSGFKDLRLYRDFGINWDNFNEDTDFMDTFSTGPRMFRIDVYAIGSSNYLCGMSKHHFINGDHENYFNYLTFDVDWPQ